ncbi:MAG: hypothetical protein ETSY1_08965 [Candidatus Entotheonella factor]|uniref:Sulfatase-modifying factor enzyme-like domain-containing protein n=1 Tax=Entotheonella factor TaxID=1429438 RepID=W4LSL7_ENTF1|nr:MAG: hypothetical protein ETSY1_08965 [Candidatus Entotheonella factor]
MDPHVNAFLDAVSERHIRRLGPADYLAVQHLLQRRPDLSRDELRAALASLLATNRDQWRQMANLFDRFAAPLPEERRASISPDARPTWKSALHNLPHQWRLAGLMVVLGLALTLAVGLLLWQPQVQDSSDTSSPLPKTEQTTHETRWILREVTPAQTQTLDLPPQRRPWDYRDGWTITLAAVLVLLGLRWLMLPGMVVRSRRQQSEQRRQHVARERRRLAQQAERQHAPLALTYHVVRHAPMEATAVDDAATLLGRLFHTGLSDDLDVAATVRTSIDAGGRFVPVYAEFPVGRGFTVLVDTERGDSPWLLGIRWVLERWAALGVRFEVYEFQFDPQFVTAQATHTTSTFANLARRVRGEPLLVISRTLSTQGLQGWADWLDDIDAWPVKAWLDPDPRPLRERRREREEIGKLEQLGLRRFPFSPRGLRALARYFSEAGEGVTVPPWPDLPPLNNLQVAEGLRTWALLAALVPDASWDQLDAIRRYFPELVAVLPEPYHVQRLIEWVMREDGVRQAESENGRTLVLSDALVERLIREQRQRDAAKPKAQRLETRGRQLLLHQLDATPPQDELLRQLWEAKRVSHLLYLQPEQAMESLHELLDGAAGTEVLQAVEAELDREVMATVFEPGMRGRLSVLAGRAADRLRLMDLLGGSRRSWMLAVSATAMAIVGLLMAGIGFDAGSWLLILPPSGRDILVSPAVWQVDKIGRVIRDTLADGTLGPEMVVIPQGELMMGSPASEHRRDDDEIQHRVRITRPFAMGKYEVTFAEYDRFAEQTQREMPYDQRWGRGNRPVINVSWYDATAYAKWLSEQTGKRYRLPTEAEWEYAARAETSTAYSFGNDASQLQAYAWCGDVALDRTQPVDSLIPNPWGLYHMHGNVWEWVQDRYGQYDLDVSMPITWKTVASNATTAVVNPGGPPSGSLHVFRGGGWDSGAGSCRSASRNGGVPGYAYLIRGFRLLRHLD